MSGRVRIKICGIRTPQAAEAAANAGADMIGLVFVADSPRHVNIDQARAIVEDVGPIVEPVGVFTDQPVDFVLEVISTVGLAKVQLHGSHWDELIDELSPTPVIRAVSFDPHTIGPALVTSPGVEAVLIDTPDPSKLGGGTGQTFDWTALADVLVKHDTAEPIILAGGLTVENVAQAIHIVQPYAVDVSSGVESKRGVKDMHKILAFCRAVRSL